MDLDFWDDEGEFVTEFPEYNLDLSDLQLCKIKTINKFIAQNVLCLESIRNGEQAICNVEGFWLNVYLDVGDVINISAKKLDGQWLINNDCGLLIFEPDLLVSTTSVVGSIWCKRRNILADKFRGFEPANEIMVVGTFVHVILQTSLRKKITDVKELAALVDKELSTFSSVRTLYELGLTADHLREKMNEFIPNIQKFVQRYVQNDSDERMQTNEDNWEGVMGTIDDIEENIWSVDLGLKGKIDISLKTDFNVFPLEIKTGRASFSLEHKGQIILYVMMMQKLGYNASSGLLLYIKENILKEVNATKKEMRDLLILRNEVAYYLTREPKIEDENSQSVKIYPPEVPPPINHQNCHKCPYKYVCSSYTKHFEENISSNKVLRELQEEISTEISEAHLNYLMKWIALLDLESKSDRNLREIYTQTPEQREAKGQCITNLKVVNVGEEVNGIYEHSFQKNDSRGNLYSNGMMEGNYVLVSTNKRTAIASGFVTCLTPEIISVSLERNLNVKYANENFHIDSHKSYNKSFNFVSLSLLMELSPKAYKLRRIIIDKVQPTFLATLPKKIGKIGRSILKNLNVCQQRAVLRALTAEDYFLIKGMPGTGKTLALAALVRLLNEIGKSVLITSHTHSAVDNLCLKLVGSEIQFMRLGSESRIHPELKKYSEHNLTKHCQTPTELEKVYNDMQIFAVTCMGSGHPVLSKRSIDVCIIDESTQVLQSTVIRPIYCADTFILIGDPEQLPAVVKNKQARDLGMSESIFERLYKEENSSVMNINYRMNASLTALANVVTYNGELLIGSDEVAQATLKIPNKQKLNALNPEFTWIKDALDDSLENSVKFVDTGPVFNLMQKVPWKIGQKSDQSVNVDSQHENTLNIYEAAIVAKLVETLLQCGIKPDSIGVIAAFTVQVSQISEIIHSNVDVSTVDQFQGKDKNVIIYSCSKSRDPTIEGTISKNEILEDKRRLTVAITRAKQKLILVGDVATISRYSTFKKLISYLENNIIRLNNYNDFNWNFLNNVV